MATSSTQTTATTRLKRQPHIYVSSATAARFSFRQEKPQEQSTGRKCGRCNQQQPESGGPRSSKYVWCGSCGNVLYVRETPSSAPKAARPKPPSPLVIPVRVEQQIYHPINLESDIEKTMDEYRKMIEDSPTGSKASSAPSTDPLRQEEDWFEHEKLDGLVERLERAQFWSEVRAQLWDGNVEMDPEIEGLVLWQQQVQAGVA